MYFFTPDEYPHCRQDITHYSNAEAHVRTRTETKKNDATVREYLFRGWVGYLQDARVPCADMTGSAKPVSCLTARQSKKHSPIVLPLLPRCQRSCAWLRRLLRDRLALNSFYCFAAVFISATLVQRYTEISRSVKIPNIINLS